MKLKIFNKFCLISETTIQYLCKFTLSKACNNERGKERESERAQRTTEKTVGI